MAPRHYGELPIRSDLTQTIKIHNSVSVDIPKQGRSPKDLVQSCNIIHTLFSSSMLQRDTFFTNQKNKYFITYEYFMLKCLFNIRILYSFENVVFKKYLLPKQNISRKQRFLNIMDNSKDFRRVGALEPEVMCLQRTTEPILSLKTVSQCRL